MLIHEIDPIHLSDSNGQDRYVWLWPDESDPTYLSLWHTLDNEKMVTCNHNLQNPFGDPKIERVVGWIKEYYKVEGILLMKDRS